MRYARVVNRRWPARHKAAGCRAVTAANARTSGKTRRRRRLSISVVVASSPTTPLPSPPHYRFDHLSISSCEILRGVSIICLPAATTIRVQQ